LTAKAVKRLDAAVVRRVRRVRRSG